MAAKKKRTKKRFAPKGKRLRDNQAYAEFMQALITGIVKAVQLYESKKPNGDVQFDYEEEVDDT